MSPSRVASAKETTGSASSCVRMVRSGLSLTESEMCKLQRVVRHCTVDVVVGISARMPDGFVNSTSYGQVPMNANQRFVLSHALFVDTLGRATLE